MRSPDSSAQPRLAPFASILPSAVRGAIACAALLVLGAVARAGADGTSGCVGHAALWGDRIVFESAGDLWMATIPSDEGATSETTAPIPAARMTTGAGLERWPAFSPDGSLVAFVGEYDGNPEVYVMPTNGGAPRRLTFHPGRDIPLGWTPDGREILFRSQRESPLNRFELHRVSVDGGAAVREPLGECTLASIDPVSGRMAFNRWSNESWNWRGYRGGTAPDVWIASPDRRTFTRLTTTDANELFPVWSDGRIVYVSDANGRAGIFSDRPEGGDVRVLVDGNDPNAFDVRRLSADAKAGSSKVVFVRGCQASILDVKSGRVRALDLRLAGDRLDERVRLVDPVESLTALSLAPDGSCAALEARGEIVLVPIGDPKPGAAQRWRQFPGQSDARDFGLSWQTPTRVAYASDRGGSPRIVVRTLEPAGAESEVVLPGEAGQWIFAPQLSPDGTRVAYADKSLHLHVLEVPSGKESLIATATAGEITDYRWSPDGKHLAFVEPRRTGFSRIRIHSIETGTTVAIGQDSDDVSHMTLDSSPRWDPAGTYLYFLSKRHVSPLLDAFEMNFTNLSPTVICALPLDRKTPPPIPAVAAAAGFDLEKWSKAGGASADESREAPASEGAGKVKKGSADEGDPNDGGALPVVTFDARDLAARVAVLPIEHGDIDGLEAIPGGFLYLRRPPQTLDVEVWPPPLLGVPGATLHRVTLVDGKDEPVLEEKIADYAVSRDGSTVLAAKDSTLLVRTLDDGEKESTPLDLAGVRLAIDVRREWAQIFDDAWRLERDFFWRDDFGGVDWDAVRTKYAALLPRVGSRAELNELIGQMMGELGTSHLYIGGGDDFAKAKPVSVGLLGIDLERSGDAFVITRILPDTSATGGESSPLAAPHLGVAPGMALVAINGRRLDPARDPREALVGLGGQAVLVTVADDSSGTNPRSFEVVTIESELALRYRDWVESNRRHVSERSGGALGYIHLPDMDSEGLDAFVRTFYPQLDREGMVIDIRDNGGGFVSQMLIERLARRVYAWMLPRHGYAETYPQRVMEGPMAVIIDQHAGSDGDIFPESFRLRRLGPLIGTRTWGGVIGIRQDKPFVDGGSASQPEYAWWEPARGFALENAGVAPDEVVELNPADRVAGRDPQLDRTIDLLLESLRARTPGPKPPSSPGHPPAAPRGGSAAAP